ncbi:ATP-binding cassette domain-containing protein, partial [Escherichia coli]|uniref:ATP-binding cassette domain-containing protein n=1 Tax=Escherichia coli TaxID=562 RepID=UPI0026730E8F
RPILNHLDWQVNPGEHWQIVGPNGAGKTTLLRNIAGLCRPSAGWCEIGRVDNREARLAYVPQAKAPHLDR